MTLSKGTPRDCSSCATCAVISRVGRFSQDGFHSPIGFRIAAEFRAQGRDQTPDGLNSFGCETAARAGRHRLHYFGRKINHGQSNSIELRMSQWIDP